jgi:hypothetical protein
VLFDAWTDPEQVACRWDAGDERLQFLQLGVATGTSQTLDNLVAFIEEQDAFA